MRARRLTPVVEAIDSLPLHPRLGRVLNAAGASDEAALACVRTWTFAPARKGGQAVATIAHVPVTFRTGK